MNMEGLLHYRFVVKEISVEEKINGTIKSIKRIMIGIEDKRNKVVVFRK